MYNSTEDLNVTNSINASIISSHTTKIKCPQFNPAILDWMFFISLLTFVLLLIIVLKTFSGSINYKNLQCNWKMNKPDEKETSF